MTLYLIKHDLRQGLGRKRYFFLPLLFLLPLGTCYYISKVRQLTGTFPDFLISCFAGIGPVEAGGFPPKAAEIPIGWLMSMGGCLYINLDYILYDLMESGQQVIIRTGRRIRWFLSKCLWNICSCLMMFGILIVVTALATIISGGEMSLSRVTKVGAEVYRGFLDIERTGALKIWTIGVFIPLLAVMSLSMLEMSLCLFMKPVFSFLICLSLLGISAYINSPWMIGNGAMGIRLLIFVESGISIWIPVLVSGVLIAGSIIVGLIRFKKMDILGDKAGN